METWARQGRSPRSISLKRWVEYCAAASGTSGFEGWAAYADGRLAAFVICALVEGCYTILCQGSATDMLAHHPNNALAYSVTRDALSRSDVQFVSYGLRSVEATPGLDHFKERMGFHLRPYRENLVATPIARYILACGGASALQLLAKKYPSSDVLRKAASLAHSLIL